MDAIRVSGLKRSLLARVMQSHPESDVCMAIPLQEWMIAARKFQASPSNSCLLKLRITATELPSR